MIETTPVRASNSPAIRSVYIVDDHPLVRESMITLITRQPDLRVCGEAGDSDTAFSEITEKQPDALILDLSLPGESGLELIKRLQAIPRPPKILVLSMHDETVYAERVLRAGALGYVMKHETTDKVLEAVRKVLQGKAYVSGAFAAQLAERLAGATGPWQTSIEAALSDRELEVFRLIGQGKGTRKIAEELGVSIKTVQTHCARMKEKLGVNSALALAREAVRWSERDSIS